ncbi:hypothetical protein SNE40_004919 [Patella caerulea]|uniref:LicD/FKTN/FKRP nucleotidyltransferase domain-containing protein n=1 Tax=Patella caerulea TaxID=87958 RepID=A0AAN8KAQ4_PATCE
MASKGGRVCKYFMTCVLYLSDRMLRSKWFMLMCLINMVLCMTIIRSDFTNGAVNSRRVSTTSKLNKTFFLQQERQSRKDLSESIHQFSENATYLLKLFDQLFQNDTNIGSNWTFYLNDRLKSNKSYQKGPMGLLRRSSSYHSKPRIFNSVILNRRSAVKSTAFLPVMSTKYRRVLQDILLKCKYLLDKSAVSYFMYSGTLLGSYRHHDIIPWDDDADIVVNISHRKTVFKLFSNLRPSFILEIRQKVRWKLYSIHSRPIKRVSWSWPFLDISFFKENSTHIWDADDRFNKTFIYKKEDVFPLTRRPFMGMLLPAPKNTTNVILQTYNPQLCKSLRYSHKFETNVDSGYKVNCDLLNTRYPRVKRTQLSNGVNETLEFQGKVISWFYSPTA